MKLWHYQIITFIAAILARAPFSQGPEDLMIGGFVPWVLPALLALALKHKRTWFSRYGWPTLLLVVFVGAGLMTDLHNAPIQ